MTALEIKADYQHPQRLHIEHVVQVVVVIEYLGGSSLASKIVDFTA